METTAVSNSTGGGQQAAASYARILQEEQDVQIVDANDRDDTLATYFADSAPTHARDPVLCPELGIAIEGLPDGVTVEQLWNVL